MRMINVLPVLQHHILSIITKKHIYTQVFYESPLNVLQEKDAITEPRTAHKGQDNGNSREMLLIKPPA